MDEGERGRERRAADTCSVAAATCFAGRGVFPFVLDVMVTGHNTHLSWLMLPVAVKTSVREEVHAPPTARTIATGSDCVSDFAC